MALTLFDIRAGIAANLDAVYGTGAATNQAQVSAYMLESPVTPTLQVKGPEDTNYVEGFGRGLSLWTIVIQGFAGTALTTGAQTLLDSWWSPNGVKAAVERDRTLGGTVEDCVVEHGRHYGMMHLPSGMSLLGAEWLATVFSHNS